MADDTGVTLAPVARTARIDLLDQLRGIAILGIFFMNVPFMGAPLAAQFVDPRRIGWSAADSASWTAVQVLLEGTQRGMLELLFGAGLMIFAARAMTPDGPVAVADLYARRNLWLLFFGAVDVLVLLWAGDILHIYALAALFLFPFRKLGPRLLLLLGLGFALYTLASGGIRYAERTALIDRVEAVEAKQAAGAPVSAAEKKTLDQWRKLGERRRGAGEEARQAAEQEKRGHAGGFIAYAAMNYGFFFLLVVEWLVPTIVEAFCMMLIGVALWKWRVIQGGRSAGFYLGLALACYFIGLPLRWIAAQELLALDPIARTSWFTSEFARIATSIGHVALINLAVKAAAGRALLAPFRAAGRTAFSLYFLQQILGLFLIFAPWGLNLWNKLSWTGLYGVALGVVALELALANLWLRGFATGPLEWLWRSLAYLRFQPFRREKAGAAPEAAAPGAAQL